MIEVGIEVARAVRTALDGLDDWGLSGAREGQYRSDVVADDAALAILGAAGFGVVSEESGPRDLDRAVIAVLDPVDGSTNASRRVPWFATSVAFLDGDGVAAGVVVNQALGTVYEAARGGGARRDGAPIKASSIAAMDSALIGVAGLPPQHFGWDQFRALGAAALDMCAVAEGVLDAYIDVSDDGHAPWDYLAALLICDEAGAHVCDTGGRDLVTTEYGVRRSPIAAATTELLAAALAARGAS
jgi:fructose-1,6-bisphosphatase/inositol monophosphatase family enzyme